MISAQGKIKELKENMMMNDNKIWKRKNLVEIGSPLFVYDSVGIKIDIIISGEAYPTPEYRIEKDRDGWNLRRLHYDGDRHTYRLWFSGFKTLKEAKEEAEAIRY